MNKREEVTKEKASAMYKNVCQFWRR